MPLTIRKVTTDIAPLLVRVVDMESGGVAAMFWDEMAPPGTHGSEVGLSLVAQESGEFSYRNGFIAERYGTDLGGLIGYAHPPAPQPVNPEIPEVFVGIEELAQLVPGYWYINFMATVPEARRQGVGAALLDEAEKQARNCSCPGLALIVAASNEHAIRAYQWTGYIEQARRSSDLGEETTEALLMVKGFS